MTKQCAKKAKIGTCNICADLEIVFRMGEEGPRPFFSKTVN